MSLHKNEEEPTLREGSETASQCTLAMSEESSTPHQTDEVNPLEILAFRNLVPGTASDCDSGYNRPLTFTAAPCYSGYEHDKTVSSKQSSYRPLDNIHDELRLQTPAINDGKRSETACSIPSISLSSSTVKVQPDGHSFIRKALHKPACCHHCGEVIWGILSTGVQCEICNFLAHERCQLSIYSPCTAVASLRLKSPISHCWSDPLHLKRRFCNVCRKRIEDSLSVRCEVCEYYCHADCQDYAVNDCKRGAAYQPGKPSSPPRPTHHWREGNLPPNSKCVQCRKTCWSSECLTGYRCQWCGLTAHGACVPQLTEVCDFGPLRDIMLPSLCVSLPRPTIPVENVIGVTKRPRCESQQCSRAISEDWSSSGDSKEDSWQDRRSPKETIDRASSDEYVCVFDGIGGLKRRSWRSFSFSKTMSTYSAVKQCLKTFHLVGSPEYYNVYEVNDRDGRENKLNARANFRSQLRFDVKQPSIVLRAKEPPEPQLTVQVYAGDLGYILPQNAADFEEVVISPDTITAEVVSRSLDKFGCGHLGPDDCYLMSVCMDGSVSEHRLLPDELLSNFLSQLRQESARISQLTRLELRFTVDPSDKQTVALFVGNLKENLSQRLYECILLEKLGEEYRWDSIDTIYYETGGIVLIYRSGEKAERAYDLLKDSTLMEKPLTALLLPTIHPELLPHGVQPLLVFVNLKSGGCQGMDLIVSFRRLLNPFQVFNLDYGGPLPGLYCFRHVDSYKILICGGDGTVGWTLSCLDIVGQDAVCNSPPIAPLPLGTGNDLARMLRWGSGYSSAEDPLAVLKDVVAAEEVQLDRWTFVVRPDEEFKDEAKFAIENQNNAANTNEDNSIMVIMNSYFGIGIDADMTLDFHNARSENPSKFNSRIHNKGVYFKIGLRKMINRTACKDLHKQIVVFADGKVLPLPPIEGLIVLNILSWAAGANPWGVERDDGFAKPTHYDGLLEVVGVSGFVHMGQIYSGLGSGIRLAQAGHLKIVLKNELPIQIDGEPFIHPAGQIVVLRSALRATMLRKVKRVKRRTMETSLPGELSRLTLQSSSIQPESMDTILSDHASSSTPVTTPPARQQTVPPAGGSNFTLTDADWSSSDVLPLSHYDDDDRTPLTSSETTTSTLTPSSQHQHVPIITMEDSPRLPACLLAADDGVEAPIMPASTHTTNGSTVSTTITAAGTAVIDKSNVNIPDQ